MKKLLYILWIFAFLFVCIFAIAGVSEALVIRDFTDFDEYDPESGITVTADTITSGAITEGSVRDYVGFEYNFGLLKRVKTSITDLTSGYRAGVFASTDETGPADTWEEGLLLYWKVDSGSPYLVLEDIGEADSDTSTALSEDTDYYVKLQKHWEWATATIYTDPSFEFGTVDTLTIDTDPSQRASHTYAYYAFGTYDDQDYREDGVDGGGWTGAGTCATAPSYGTDGRDCWIMSASSGNYCRRSRDIGTFGGNDYCEFTCKFDGLTTMGDGDDTALELTWYDGTDRVIFYIFSDYLYDRIMDESVEIGTDLVDNIWYTFSVDFDWTAGTADISVKKEGETSFTSIGQFNNLDPQPLTDGIFYWNVRSDSSTITVYMDEFKMWENTPAVTTDSAPIIVEDLTTYSVERTGYAHVQKNCTGYTISEDFADLDDWTTGGTGTNNTCTVSDGKMTYNGAAYAFATFTPAADQIANYFAWEGQFSAFDKGRYKFLGGITINTSTIGTDGTAQVVLRRVGDEYSVGLRANTYGSPSFSGESWSEMVLSPAEDYVFELASGQGQTALLINGSPACIVDGGIHGTATWENNRIFFGNQDGNDYDGADDTDETVTINYVRFIKNQAFFHGCGIAKSDDGDVVIGIRQSDEHSFQDTSGKAFLLYSEDGAAFSFGTMVDEPNVDDSFWNGTGIYSFNTNILARKRSSVADDYYGSSNDGVTWSNAIDETDDYFSISGEPDSYNANGIEVFEYGTGNWGFWEPILQNWVPTYSTTNVCFGFRSLSDWSITTGSEITGFEEDTGETGAVPNETFFFRVPTGFDLVNEGRLIAIVRWDDVNSYLYPAFCTWYYSDENIATLMTTGAGTPETWTYGGDLRDTWGAVAGSQKGVVVGKYLMVHGRIQDAADGNWVNTLMKIDLSGDNFLGVIKSYLWNYAQKNGAETGNGAILPDADNQNKLYVLTSATTTQYYDFTLESPAVTITSPTSEATYQTTDSTITLSGSAIIGDADIDAVTWDNDVGSNGTCTGTTSWSEAGIALELGANIITITATDEDGVTGTDTITVTRTASDTYWMRLLAQ